MIRLWLLILYLLIWTLLAIAPNYRDDWLLENILVVVAVPLVLWLHHHQPFSVRASLLLWIFFVLHAIGSHYTYAEMPWFSQLSQQFGLGRNHFDRLVHFLYGLLIFLPLTEQLQPHIHRRGTRIIITLLLLFSSSGSYEILEWLATEVTHPELGTAFLGTQGDPWDAQQDMALAHLGSILAAIIHLCSSGLSDLTSRSGKQTA